VIIVAAHRPGGLLAPHTLLQPALAVCQILIAMGTGAG
jgi:hypothetical protein